MDPASFGPHSCWIEPDLVLLLDTTRIVNLVNYASADLLVDPAAAGPIVPLVNPAAAGSLIDAYI